MSSGKHIFLIVRTDVAPEMEAGSTAGTTKNIFFGYFKVPGVLWAKRGVNSGKGKKYTVVYEHESGEVQKTAEYQDALETDWVHKFRPYPRNFAREIYRLL